MSQLEIKNLTLAYDGAPVVSNLSFSLEKGDYLCVVGENGSGKSTLIKCIAGLVKPMSGSVVYESGVKGIGYLPQQQSAQRDFPASVREVVMSGFAGKLGFRSFYSKEMKRKAEENMCLLNIEELANRPFGVLSGGQQQRVLLARALAAAEGLLLLDEPINGLDPQAAADMYTVIKRLNESGITVVMISHDVGSAVLNAKKILHLSADGYFFGTSADYLLSEHGTKLSKEGAL